MEFYVAEYLLRYFVPDCTGEGNKHGPGEGLLHELPHHRMIISDKWTQIAGFGTETQGYGQFKQETYMEITEIRLHGIQKDNALFTPLEEAWFVDSILYCPIKHLGQEHGHGILEDIASDTQKGIFC